jgi:uncharacterized protein (UPF0248 family)
MKKPSPSQAARASDDVAVVLRCFYATADEMIPAGRVVRVSADEANRLIGIGAAASAD